MADNRLIPFEVHSTSGVLTDAGQIRVDATGFDGNLDQDDVNIQHLAQTIDDLSIPGTPGEVAASNVSVVDTDLTGIVANSNDVQEALKRIDNTGLGAQSRSFSGTFFGSSYGASGNQGIWYGGRQTVTVETERTQTTNGQYIFEVPDLDELNSMFDDLAARSLGEIYTITLVHRAGSSSSVVRNSLLVRTSFGTNAIGFQPTTITQGQSVTYRVERIGGSVQSWERLGVQQAATPVATLGDVILQNVGWNNANDSFLPPSASVQKGYAFPVIGSSPNDGTLRQGLIDAGVSDRVIYDDDYVIWSADAFTSWTNGDDWFVLSRNDLQRMSREQSNFLSQVTESDQRVDVAPVSQLTSNALVWLSENALAEAPFLTPSTDPNNPRSGDDYAYIGGTEDRNAMGQFQFSQNRFQSFITVGITPNFITAHPADDIRVRIYDTDRVLLDEFNLEDDFDFVDDATFTNSTVRHYQRSTTVNYPFLATIEIWLTRIANHFSLDRETVDVTQNVTNLTEDRLSADVAEKLNRTLAPVGTDFSSIESRLSPYATVSNRAPDHDALFLSAAASTTFPSGIGAFSTVAANNPQFTATDVVLFVATPEPGSFALINVTNDTATPLEQSQGTVDVIESVNVNGTTYFVYRVTGIASGDVVEVDRVTTHQVVAWAADIDNLQEDISRIDAELEHAVLDLPAKVVDVLTNEVAVTEESTPTINITAYNKQLAGPSNTTQTVFRESSPNTPSGGVKASKPINETTGGRAQRKLVYIPESTDYINQAYLTAFDGTTGRDIITYANGEFSVKVRTPGVPDSTSTETIYPAPSNRVSGAGIWIRVPALTFVNGVPVPEADEVFFTRNVPRSAVTLNIQYRGHANGNVFGEGSTTLAGVGGGSDVSTTLSLDDGSEQASVQVRYTASDKLIRVSVTERVNTGLPTINDVEVILSYDEVRNIPATTGTTRDVQLEHVHSGAQVFAIKPSSTGNLIVVGDRTEIDTGRSYSTFFGASETGHLIVPVTTATFLDYQDFEPISTTVEDLENHAGLPQFGLFSTSYTRETVVDWGTTFRPIGLNVGNLPTSATGLATGDVWFNGTALQFVP